MTTRVLICDDSSLARKQMARALPKNWNAEDFCVQDPDVEGLAEKIVAAGGKQRMPVREYFPGEKPYRMVYMEDPFGNILEIYSHSYELTYSAGAYE